MRSIPASEIFRVACALHGQPWSHRAGEDSLSLTDFRMVRGLLNDRLNSAWHSFPWPSLVEYQFRRRLSRVFDYATAYAPMDQVYDAVSNLCWHCVRLTTPTNSNPGDAPAYWAQFNVSKTAAKRTNDPVAQFNLGDRVLNPQDGNVYYCLADGAFFADIYNPLKFTPLPDFDPAFPLEDEFQTPMSEVLGVSADELCLLEFRLVDDAVRVEGDPGGAWFRYRIRCPIINGDPWDAEATYTYGDQVYYTRTDNAGTGDFYACLNSSTPGEIPEANPLLWRRVELPYLFGNYLQWAVHADWYELDGQQEKAGTAATKAFERLTLEFDKIERQQRQEEPWNVSTR